MFVRFLHQRPPWWHYGPSAVLGCALPLGHGHPTPFGRPAEPKADQFVAKQSRQLGSTYCGGCQDSNKVAWIILHHRCRSTQIIFIFIHVHINNHNYSICISRRCVTVQLSSSYLGVSLGTRPHHRKQSENLRSAVPTFYGEQILIVQTRTGVRQGVHQSTCRRHGQKFHLAKANTIGIRHLPAALSRRSRQGQN